MFNQDKEKGISTYIYKQAIHHLYRITNMCCPFIVDFKSQMERGIHFQSEAQRSYNCAAGFR